MEEHLSRRLTVILHADVVGSTALVQRDEALAHKRIQDTFRRLSQTINAYGGATHEIRGDALVAEFNRASAAVAASLAFQTENSHFNATLADDLQPNLRIGISLGEVVVADNTVTGEGIVLAQRLEQLAPAGGVCIQGAVHEAVPGRLPFEYESLGEQGLKGFSEPVRAYSVTLRSDQAIPPPEVHATFNRTLQARAKRRWIAVSALVVIVFGGLALFQPWIPKEDSPSVGSTMLSLPDKPSIVVLPFSNLSDHPQGELLADGFTETITATIGQVPGLFVISRNSAFTYKGKAVKVRQVGRELGVRYVLEGSVQRVGSRVRITTQLVDATTDEHIWVERYDRELRDIFELQDNIALNVLVALQVELTEGEQATVRSHTTNNIEAYLLYVRALVPFRTFTKNGMTDARKLAAQSLAIDPDYAGALILSAWTHIIDARFGYGASRDKSFTEAARLLDVAQNLDIPLPDSARGELLMARAFIDLIQERYESAVVLGSEAITLSPNDSFLVAVQGMILFFTRRYDQSIEQLQRAMRLSPTYPSWYPLWLSAAYVFNGDHERALTVTKREIRRAESDFIRAAHHIRAAFAYADQGETELAKQEMAQAKDLNSLATLKWYRVLMHFQHEEDWQRFAEAMRKAGLPE